MRTAEDFFGYRSKCKAGKWESVTTDCFVSYYQHKLYDCTSNIFSLTIRYLLSLPEKIYLILEKATNVTLSSSNIREHHMSHIVLCTGKFDSWLEMTASKTPLSFTNTMEVNVTFSSSSASWIWIWGLMTATLGLELKPGVSQRLCKVVIDGACDGHRVGHRLCFFVVFAQAATEVLLNNRIAYCVR